MPAAAELRKRIEHFKITYSTSSVDSSRKKFAFCKKFSAEGHHRKNAKIFTLEKRKFELWHFDRFVIILRIVRHETKKFQIFSGKKELVLSDHEKNGSLIILHFHGGQVIKLRGAKILANILNFVKQLPRCSHCDTDICGNAKVQCETSHES